MKKRFSEEQIIGFSKEAEAGMPVRELCRKHGFSDASCYTWRPKFGGMEGSEALRHSSGLSVCSQVSRNVRRRTQSL
jgi:putative transposase